MMKTWPKKITQDNNKGCMGYPFITPLLPTRRPNRPGLQ